MGDYLRQTGLLREHDNVALRFQMNGLKLIDQTIADLEEQKRTLENLHGTNDLSEDIISRIKTLEERKNRARRKKTYDLTREMLRSIKEAVEERDRIRRTSPHFKHLNFSQALLLKRMNMIHIKNLHKLTMMRKFSSLIRSQRSHEEFNMVFQYFEARLSNLQSYERAKKLYFFRL